MDEMEFDSISSLSTERALLGAVAVDPSIVDGLELTDADFSGAGHGVLFRAYTTLFKEHGYVDEHLLKDWAKQNYSGPLGDLWMAMGKAHDAFGSPRGAGGYARVIRDYAHIRAVVDAGRDIVEIGSWADSPTSAMSQAIERLERAATVVDVVGSVGVGDVANDYVKNVLAIQDGLVEHVCNPSGLDALDGVTGGGFKPGWQVVVIASAGHGKSALAINNFALSAALAGRPALVCSLEMPAKDVVGRLIATLSGVPAHLHHRKGEIDGYQQSALVNAADTLGRLPLVVTEKPRDVASVAAEARSMHRKYGELGVVVVDYLQLLASPTLRRDGTQEEEISANSKAMKRVAIDLECTSIVLSQPNSAAKRTNKLITVRDAKGSGAIEDDCDLALSPFLFHKADPQGNHPRNLCKIGMSKFRHGLETSLSETDVIWNGSKMMFQSRNDL